MCDAVVMEDPWLLRYVPDWFVTQQQAKSLDDYCMGIFVDFLNMGIFVSGDWIQRFV